VNLGHAAEAVGVLHAGIVVAVGLADFAFGEQGAEVGGGCCLAGMGANGLDAWIERGGRTAESFEGHGPGEVAELDDAEGAGEGEAADGGDGLGSIEKGQTLFGFEGERDDACPKECEGGGDAASVSVNHAFTDDGEGEVSEGRKVAAGSDGSARGNNGVNAAVEEGNEGLNQLRADAAEAFGENIGAEEEHGADGILGEGVADAAGVAADEITLEGLDLGGVNAKVGKLAEAGVDAVGGVSAGEEIVDESAGGLDCGKRGRGERDRAVVEGDLGDFVEGEGLAGEQKRSCHNR
jgi:hypothetical protein